MTELLHTVLIFSSRGLLTALILLGSAQLTVAQPTNIAIGSATLQPSVKRLGINLSYETFYDSGQVTKNLIFRNPGFEGEIFQSTIRCASGTANSCIDDNPYSAWPDAFWNGASVEFFYGSAKGRQETVTNFTKPVGSTGGRFVFSGSGVVPATGDYLIVRKATAGSADAGWWKVSTGQGTVTTNFTDLPPGTAGRQTVAVNAPGASDTASLAAYFDSTPGRSFVALNGTFQLSFKAKGIAGGNTIALNLQRGGLSPYLNQPVKLTNSWNTYNLTFNAAETGAAVGTVGVKFGANAANSFLLDDVSLTQLNTDPSNTTAFRDPVVNALKQLNPGVLRFWANQLGDTLDNLIAPTYARQRSGYSAWATRQDDISFGLPEFLQLCENVGTEPWLVVPATFSVTEAANLIEYLSGGTSTPYGAKRAASGRSAPWASSFRKIHLEFGNEAWNGGFKGGAIEYPTPYGQRSQAIFAAMRASSFYSTSTFDLILGGQAATPSRNKDIQNNCNNNDTFALAPYMMGTVDSNTSDESLYGSSFAEAEAYHATSGTAENVANGLMRQNMLALQASSHPVPLALYEMNLSTLDGTISQDTLKSYAASLGAGLAVVDSMLQQMRQGVLLQSLYALQQYEFMRQDRKNVPLWGSVVDMGVTDRRRPQFLALQLANQAIGDNSSMIETVHTGADPTWNQPLVNTVQLSGAHYLQSFAFSSGSQRSLVVFNLHRTSSLPLTFAGANAPNGSIRLQQLTSTSPKDTNEDSSKVNITSQTLNGFNALTGLSVPPFSMSVLTWTGNGSSNPVISSVTPNPSGDGRAATITWTTDQPATTQVRYGTTASYGSSTAFESGLSTGHSVVVSGLTPGTTYHYSVQSANSAGGLSTSPNATFFTPTKGPLVSAVASSAITATSATITWITDKPSSSRVAYGTTTGYGSLSAFDPSMVTSHSVTLTGLTLGTTYNFAVTSAVSADSTTSTNYSFSTPATGLVITGVTATSVTSTSATISWTTDKPSSSQAAYGTSTAYGSFSAYNPALLTAHSVNLTALTPGTAYNFAVTSVAATGTGTSANFTFSTSGSQPIISAVSATTIAATSATISWTTDMPSSSQAVFGTTQAYGSFSSYNPALLTQHSVTLSPLNPGTTYHYAVSSVAATGTATSTDFTFSTVGSAPVISSISATAISRTSATITWSTDNASSTQVAYGPTSAYGFTSAYNSSPLTWHSVTLTGLTGGTTYQYAAISATATGSTTSANFTFSTLASAPTITAVAATGITLTSATISWITDTASGTQVTYGPTTAYGAYSAYNPTMVTVHSATLTGLNPGSTYNYAVSSSGAGGNATSGNFAFSTLSGPPVITSAISATAISTMSATITWATDKASSSTVSFGSVANFSVAATSNPTLETWHSVTLSALNPGTTYSYTVSSVGPGGTATSVPLTFSTLAAPPVIYSVTATAIGPTSAIITWVTDRVSTSQVSYGATTSYGITSAFNPAPHSLHSVTLSGLVPGRFYNYAVSSVNSAGSITSTNYTFTTTAQ